MEKNEKAELKEYGVQADQHWSEIMALAEQYGFIIQAYGGTAVLVTHANQLKEYGEEEYLRIQKMDGHCPKDCGYPGCLEDGKVKSCGSCCALKHGAKWVKFEKNPRHK